MTRIRTIRPDTGTEVEAEIVLDRPGAKRVLVEDCSTGQQFAVDRSAVRPVEAQIRRTATQPPIRAGRMARLAPWGGRRAF